MRKLILEFYQFTRQNSKIIISIIIFLINVLSKNEQVVRDKTIVFLNYYKLAMIWKIDNRAEMLKH